MRVSRQREREIRENCCSTKYIGDQKSDTKYFGDQTIDTCHRSYGRYERIVVLQNISQIKRAIQNISEIKRALQNISEIKRSIHVIVHTGDTRELLFYKIYRRLNERYTSQCGHVIVHTCVQYRTRAGLVVKVAFLTRLDNRAVHRVGRGRRGTIGGAPGSLGPGTNIKCAFSLSSLYSQITSQRVSSPPLSTLAVSAPYGCDRKLPMNTNTGSGSTAEYPSNMRRKRSIT